MRIGAAAKAADMVQDHFFRRKAALRAMPVARIKQPSAEVRVRSGRGLGADSTDSTGGASGTVKTSHHVGRGDFEAVASSFLGVIERMVGFCQEFWHVEDCALAMHEANTHRTTDRTAIDLPRHLREAFANSFSDRDCLLATGVGKHGSKLLATEAPNQIGVAH